MFIFQVGFFLVLFARCLGLASVRPDQADFNAAMEMVGRVAAAGGGALFTILLAVQGREWLRAAGFAAIVATTLGAEPVVARVLPAAALPSAPALLYLCVAAYVFATRRRLFPELTRNVLDASVFDSRDAVVIFDAQGSYVESGTPGLEDLLSFAGMRDIATSWGASAARWWRGSSSRRTMCGHSPSAA